MKIAHIVRRFSFKEWGGTETAVWNIALQQRAQGWVPEILCTAALDKIGDEMVEGIAIRRFPYFYPYFPLPASDRLALDKKGGNPYAPRLIDVLKNGDYNIFHIHTGGRLARYSAMTGRKRGIPSVMSLHGGSCTIPRQELELMLKPLKHKVSYGGLFDRIYLGTAPPEMLADLLLALNKEEAAALKRQFPAQKVQVFPNGVLHRNLPEAGEFRRKYHIPEATALILCVSRIDYQKNQKLLIDLLACTKETHLLLIGPITAKWYYEELLQHAEKLHVSNRLTVIPGLLPDSVELLQAFKTADCFVLPSHHEPFGIVALEALDAGIPLIAANVGGLKDFLRDGQNALLFDDNDIESLLKAYQKMDPLRKQLVSNGKVTAKEYHWETLVGTLNGMYQELL